MLTTVEEPVEKRYKINDTSITKEQQKTLRDILEEYSDVFAKNHRAPKECVRAKHYIQSKSDQVCYEKVRWIPAKWKDDIKTQGVEMQIIPLRIRTILQRWYVFVMGLFASLNPRTTVM